MGCSGSAASSEAQGANHGKDGENSKDSRSKRDFHEQYILGARIGRGSFGQVRLATKAQRTVSKESQHTVSKESNDIRDAKSTLLAVKIIDLRRQVEQTQHISKTKQVSALNEVMTWREVGKHRNVIKLVDFFWGETFCYFVMEKCEMSLFTAMRKESKLDEQVLGLFLSQMAKGLAFVHSAKVIHRDIKPDNFLVARGRHVKLGDFGLSTIMPTKGDIQGVYGTAPFMPPEMVKIEGYGQGADVWSFAVIVYTLFFGCFPYTPVASSTQAMKQAILDDSPKPSFRPHGRIKNGRISDKAMQFIRALLIRSPQKRPTADQMLLEPWMQQAIGSEPWDEDMPSLRPMLLSARKEGAFDFQAEHKKVLADREADELLNELQAKYHNVCLPELDQSVKDAEESLKECPGDMKTNSHLEHDLNLEMCSTRPSLSAGSSVGTGLKSEELMPRETHLDALPRFGDDDQLTPEISL